MKTKVLMAIGLSALLGTALYAKCDMKDGQKMQNGNSCTFDGKKMNYKKSHKGGMLSILKELNLSDKQKEDIAAIKKELMQKDVSPNVAFTKDSFDKEKFIEIMKQKRENMIESKAEMYDRIYKILTPEQKEQFKTLLDLKKEKRVAMMDKRMNFDKNCNGGR